MVVTQPLKDGFWLKAIQLKRHGCRLLIHGMCHVVVVLHELTGTAVFKVIRAWGRPHLDPEFAACEKTFKKNRAHYGNGF